MRSAVLPGHADGAAEGPFTDISAIDQESLFTALHGQDELGDRYVWNGLKGRSNTPSDGVHPADDHCLDRLMRWTAQSRNEIGELVV